MLSLGLSWAEFGVVQRENRGLWRLSVKKGFVELKKACGFVAKLETLWLILFLVCSVRIIECVFGLRYGGCGVVWDLGLNG